MFPNLKTRKPVLPYQCKIPTGEDKKHQISTFSIRNFEKTDSGILVKFSTNTIIHLFFSYYFADNFYDQESGSNGCVCIFSLKNPSYPEYLCQAQSGVICVDIHSDHPHMLAVGLADGNVRILSFSPPHGFTKSTITNFEFLLMPTLNQSGFFIFCCCSEFWIGNS